MSFINIPTYTECIKLLDKYASNKEILSRVKEHSFVVTKIVKFLAEKLNEAGENINVELVENAALLHDIEKTNAIENPLINHGNSGEQTLKKEGFPEIGVIVGKHLKEKINQCKTWEEKLLIYADSRVNFNKIVSIDERDNCLFERYKSIYPTIRDEVKFAKPFLHKIENEIFSKINLKSEDLTKYIK